MVDSTTDEDGKNTMDMTIAPSLCEMDVEKLARTRRNSGDHVVVDAITAAIALDAGNLAQAQAGMLDVVNSFAAYGAHVTAETAASVRSVIANLTGHRAQTCSVRVCLDIVVTLHDNPASQTVGERIGRVLQTTGALAAAERRRFAA